MTRGLKLDGDGFVSMIPEKMLHMHWVFPASAQYHPRPDPAKHHLIARLFASRMLIQMQWLCRPCGLELPMTDLWTSLSGIGDNTCLQLQAYQLLLKSQVDPPP